MRPNREKEDERDYNTMHETKPGGFIHTEPGSVHVVEDRWRHRSELMICQGCMYFVPKRLDFGRCRRRSPTLNGWPAVFEKDWCGDHKLDENRIPEKMPF